jgi:hypothetical protein
MAKLPVADFSAPIVSQGVALHIMQLENVKVTLQEDDIYDAVLRVQEDRLPNTLLRMCVIPVLWHCGS